jgi:hypothetical protein
MNHHTLELLSSDVTAKGKWTWIGDFLWWTVGVDQFESGAVFTVEVSNVENARDEPPIDDYVGIDLVPLFSGGSFLSALGPASPVSATCDVAFLHGAIVRFTCAPGGAGNLVIVQTTNDADSPDMLVVSGNTISIHARRSDMSNHHVDELLTAFTGGISVTAGAVTATLIAGDAPSSIVAAGDPPLPHQLSGGSDGGGTPVALFGSILTSIPARWIRVTKTASTSPIVSTATLLGTFTP